MEMVGEHQIPAPRALVWRGLTDPSVLKECIPGCETIEKMSDVEFGAKVHLTIGPVRARFSGRVTLTDLDPGRSCTIQGEGQGGIAGFGKGLAVVCLEDAPSFGTVLRYKAQATVGGKIAQVGARLIDATAKKLADEFFERFASLAPRIGQQDVDDGSAAASVGALPDREPSGEHAYSMPLRGDPVKRPKLHRAALFSVIVALGLAALAGIYWLKVHP